MAEHDQPSGEEQRGRGIVSRLTEGIGRAGQVAHRASDVFTGADIRAFDEFTDAVTRVTVGLHRDPGRTSGAHGTAQPKRGGDPGYSSINRRSAYGRRERTGCSKGAKSGERDQPVMAHADIAALADAYPPQDRSALLALTERYRRRNEREILELAAIASEISLDEITTFGLELEANPQLQEAFKSQYPNVELDSLVGRSSEEPGRVRQRR